MDIVNIKVLCSKFYVLGEKYGYVISLKT